MGIIDAKTTSKLSCLGGLKFHLYITSSSWQKQRESATASTLNFKIGITGQHKKTKHLHSSSTGIGSGNGFIHFGITNISRTKIRFGFIFVSFVDAPGQSHQQKHSASALVKEDTLLMELSRKTLMEVANYDSHLFSLLILNIARELARRLHRTDEILLLYSHKQDKSDRHST